MTDKAELGPGIPRQRGFEDTSVPLGSEKEGRVAEEKESCLNWRESD
jgi:hypothetical protein